MPDQPMGSHAGVAISLRLPEGHFHCVLDERMVIDKTLEGVKKKIDNHKRAVSRNAARGLGLVALDVAQRWGDSSESSWLEGTFAGINAHTGDATMVLNGGSRQRLHSSQYIFRPLDPDLAEVKRLVAVTDAARAALKAAEAEQEAALGEHGYCIGSRSGRRGTSGAATQEEDIVKFLGGPDA